MYTFIPTGRAMSLPKNLYVLVQGIIMIGLLGFGTNLSAQLIEASLSPTPVNTGDETELHVEIGTEGQPASNIYSFSATFEAEDFTMAAGSNFDFDVTGSWMFGNNFDFSYTINAAGTQITIDAWRNDQVGQSGYGLVGRGGEITITYDDLNKKEASLRLRLVEFKTNAIATEGLLIGPNPSSGFLLLESQTHQDLGVVKLVNLQGSVVKQWDLAQPSARLETLSIPNGLYFIVSKEGSVLHQQKVLIQH